MIRRPSNNTWRDVRCAAFKREEVETRTAIMEIKLVKSDAELEQVARVLLRRRGIAPLTTPVGAD